jgi:hypothetical protein
MNSWVGTILASFCALAGLLGTLTLVVFMAAGGANSTPAAAQTIVRLMWATGFVGLLCMAGSVAAIYGGKPGVGSIVGGMPFIVLTVLFLWTAISSIR